MFAYFTHYDELRPGPDKDVNLTTARDAVVRAAAEGADIVVLPECFNSPYGVDFFAQYAEELPGAGAERLPSTPAPSYKGLAAMARDAGVYLVGGSIPELDKRTGAIYNTCGIFSRDGTLLGKHRKVHLFDVAIPGGITFTESKVLTAGDAITVVDLPEYGKVGIAICYDIRFPEMSIVAARRGCFALIFPAAFNTTTGPLHWELQARARAMDSQVYVALCSPARSADKTSYQAWGHSMVVDPQARILVEAGEGEEIVYAELQEEAIQMARSAIPLSQQRRFDVYPDVSAEQGQSFN